MLRAAPSVMDSAALFCLASKLFLAWSPDNEYIIAHGIAQPCCGDKVRVPPKHLYCPYCKVRQAAFFRQLQARVKSLLTQLL